jgi:hypothetical protein
MRRRALIPFVALLSGCAFHKTPHVMYEGDHPLSDTAVFSSFDDKAGPAREMAARIHSVDGNKASCVQVGCPYWVRVLPGTHSFAVTYATDWNLNYHLEANLDIVVADMKPRHVYVVRYRTDGGGVAQIVEDLGENPDWGLPLGWGRAPYKVKF